MEQKETPKMTLGAWIVLAVFVIGAFLLFRACGSIFKEKTCEEKITDDYTHVIYDFVIKEKVLPSLIFPDEADVAEFQEIENSTEIEKNDSIHTYRINSYIKTKNALGVIGRNEFSAVVIYKPCAEKASVLEFSIE